MGQDKKVTQKKLKELWESPTVKTLETKNRKYVIISDLHLGDGGAADDFHKNREALIRALRHYKDSGHHLILLGDIEEFWQFDIDQILQEYEKDVYPAIKAFGLNRIHRIFGNHDLDWSLHDPLRDDSSNDHAVQALKMKDSAGKVAMLLIHGHQGSTDSDKNSWISRIIVGKVWKPIEPIFAALGIYGHPSATKSQVGTDYERIYYSWAKKNKVIVICGHSHRAIFAAKTLKVKIEDEIASLQHELVNDNLSSKQKDERIQRIDKLSRKLAEEKIKGREIESLDSKPKPCYFNSGCGLYSDGITVIEIDGNFVRLVKWHRHPTGGQNSRVFDEGELSRFVQLTNS